MSIDDLDRTLRGDLHRSGSEGYARATTPFNATIEQHPAAVVAAADADDVAAALAEARAAELRVLPQATGHGGRRLDESHLLLDTSALSGIEIDAGSRRAVVGAGVRWADLQQQAEQHGLLGLAGTTGTVGVAAYTFGGGLGWLTRAHGLASAHLHAVDVVNGSGAVRHATDDGDAADRDVLWASRGGGGAGVATSVEIGLVPASDVWVGNLLWPADQAADVVAAWAEATQHLPESLSSLVGIGLAPPSPAVPEQLHGGALVRVIGVSTEGEGPWRELHARLVEVAPAVLDESGPGDAARLGTVHLDPPVPAAGLGEGRWLDESAAGLAVDVVTSLGTGADLPLLGIELRHVGTTAGPTVDGALTHVPGTYLLHTIGRAADPEMLARTREAVSAVHAVAEPAWVRRAASFCSNVGAVPDALTPDAQERLAAVHGTVDPDGVIVRPSVIG